MEVSFGSTGRVLLQLVQSKCNNRVLTKLRLGGMGEMWRQLRNAVEGTDGGQTLLLI